MKHTEIQQSDSVIHTHVFILFYFPIYVVTQYWAEFSVLYSRSLLVIHFKYSSVWVVYFKIVRFLLCDLYFNKIKKKKLWLKKTLPFWYFFGGLTWFCLPDQCIWPVFPCKTLPKPASREGILDLQSVEMFIPSL